MDWVVKGNKQESNSSRGGNQDEVLVQRFIETFLQTEEGG